MSPLLHEIQGMIVFNNWIQILSTICAFFSVISIMFLWRYGNKMIDSLIEREQKASRKIKAVEKAAEQMRKDLLSTQQDQDIANQRRQLAEMDADALRKELERTRTQYAKAENAFKDRIGELKNLNITQSNLSQSATGSTTMGVKKSALDNEQKKMLSKLLQSGPKGELDIISVLDNADSHEMAVELKSYLDHYGWATRDIVQSAFTNPPDGLVLVIHSKQTAPSYAKFLQRMFTTIGLHVSAQINEKYPEWSISLIIGQRES